jgi:hypothetical protein
MFLTQFLRNTALVVMGLVAGPGHAQEGGGLTRAEFEILLKELDLKRQPWTAIPWKISVTEARELAARTGKPIFCVVNTGNCLGAV